MDAVNQLFYSCSVIQTRIRVDSFQDSVSLLIFQMVAPSFTDPLVVCLMDASLLTFSVSFSSSHFNFYLLPFISIIKFRIFQLDYLLRLVNYLDTYINIDPYPPPSPSCSSSVIYHFCFIFILSCSRWGPQGRSPGSLGYPKYILIFN